MKNPRLNKASRRQGILLVECMVYIALCMVIAGLAFAIFYQCQTQSVHLRRQTEHVAITMRFGERWRAETRNAVSAPYLAEGEQTIAFHIPQKAGEIVYLYNGAEVWRKDSKSENYVLFVESIRRLKFIKEERQIVKGWRMELELQSHEQHRRVKPLFSFLSVHPN